MNLLMQECSDHSELTHSQWDIGFIGSSLDDRGGEAINFVKTNCSQIIEVSYDAENMQMKIGGEIYNIDDVGPVFSQISEKKILIESTTLNFAEILIILNETKSGHNKISILYVEPKSYTRTPDHKALIREFELSEETIGFLPIPGHSGHLTENSKQIVVFMAGYESERVDRAIEENSILPKDAKLVFGVPAFQAGWEMNAFTNNLRVIKEKRILGTTYFAGANNPGAIYDILNYIHESLEVGEELFIAPVGTKPAGIATAIFVAENPNVCILYDHPLKKGTRSKEIEKWHLFEIDFT